MIISRFTWRDLPALLAFRALDLAVCAAFAVLIGCAVFNIDPTRELPAASCVCVCQPGGE